MIEIKHGLLDSAETVLIAIDVQDAFLDKLPRAERDRVLSNICWLIQVADWLDLPLIVTAEEYNEQPLTQPLIDLLGDDFPVYDKKVFGLAYQPNIMAAVEATGRKTTVLIGLETDVCVLHSAVGLLEKGYRVVVIADATGTPENSHNPALERMSRSGASILNTKGVFYEWLRDIETVNCFHTERPDMRNAAIFTL